MTKQKPTSEVSYLGKLGVFHVEEVDLTFSNGEQRKYYRLAPRNSSVNVIAYDETTQELVLISEFAGGTLEYELGLVRGGIDGEESALVAAERELSEEAGLKAGSFEVLQRVYNSTGYNKIDKYYVLARDLSPDPQPLEGDEPEPLEVVRWPVAKLDELLVHERFRDVSNLLGLYLFKDWLAKHQPK